MLRHLLGVNRIVFIGSFGIAVAIAISSFSAVRAQRFVPFNSGNYKCSTGKACVTGDSTGTPWGVYGASSGGNGVEGQSSASGKAGVSGVNLAQGAGGDGVYAQSADTSGKYAAFFGHGTKAATNLF